MNILTIDNITKSYGVRKIFDGASFFLQEGEKAGIIGINGTGKSTLLKMIAGLEEADDGTVIKANHCLVRYLPQNPEFAPEETVLEAVLRGNRVEENAGTIEADAKSMLTKLGVTEFDQPCGQLSGGQRKRLALVSVLLSPHNIYYLPSYCDVANVIIPFFSQKANIFIFYPCILYFNLIEYICCELKSMVSLVKCKEVQYHGKMCNL